MARGGARPRAGRPRTSSGRSHKAKADVRGVVTLPAEGRSGEAPAFPLSAPSPREDELWSSLWTLPQAVAWEGWHLELEVASYVRLLARAESPRSSAMIWAQTKQFAESLGLSASGMQRNRWVIGVPEDDVDEPPAVPGVVSITDRLRGLD